MKTMTKLLLLGMMSVFGCSLAKADTIIYSNNFALGTGVDINGTAPTVANSVAGGTNTARWLDVDGVNNTSGPLLDTGLDTCAQVDYWALPFTPQTNFIYLLTVNLTFNGNPGVAPEFGFSQLFVTNFPAPGSDARFNGSSNGYDWMAATEPSGNIQYFSGPKASSPSVTIANTNNIFPANTVSTDTFQILLNTKNAAWSAAGFVNGVQAGTLFTYSSNITGLKSVGISQNGSPGNPSAIQYNTFTLSTTLQPFVVVQPTPQVTVGGGSKYTNMVTVMADTNGGTLSYQWYANGLPLADGVDNVSGAHSNLLVINPIATVNQLSNYYVVVTNNFGSSTSALASVTVLTNPVVTAPLSSSNPIILFTASGSNVGSSPTFAVTAIGAPTLKYQWLTNDVPIAGATTTSLSFTNLQPGAPSTFTCVVTNGYGSSNVTWFASYQTAPTAAYPQAVLGDVPLEFWRLDETDDGLGDGNNGAIAHDYQSGNNGIYNNVSLGQLGYDSLEPSETSVFVTATGIPSSASGIVNLDLAQTMSNGVNAAFAVEGWANCQSANGGTGGAPVISQGTFGASSFFLGADTNTSTKHYQFYVRTAGGTLVSADDTVTTANDVTWHHLVGVCDEANSNISLYVDGRLAATTAIAAKSGLFESGMPMAIGAGIRPGSGNTNVPFTGNIADVAIYKHALSIGQVINHYSATGQTVPVSVVAPVPPTTLPYLANQTLTIPATVAGTGPFGYYWMDLTAGGPPLRSGTSTSSGGLDATLTIPNISSNLSGDQLELVVTNATSSSSAFVTLYNPPPPVTVDYTNPILYSNNFDGGTWALSGRAPTVANIIVGGTNSVWVDQEGTNDTTGRLMANGLVSSSQFDSWVLPFVPHPGYVYTIDATFTYTGSPGNWNGIGFSSQILSNATDGRFNGGAPGYDWMILTESSGNVQYFAGPSGGGGTIKSANSSFGNNIGSHTVQIVLDTTGTQWKDSGFVDGVQMGSTFSYSVANTPTNIVSVGVTQNSPITPGLYQWNTFSLSQTAPGGVPPYLLIPLPPTNTIVLSNGTVSIPATAFGSGPFGYYWTNNSTVIASGSTATMAPLPANLSVASGSLSAGKLQLVLTNAFGTNITSFTVVNGVNPNPGRLQASVTGNQLILSWPTNLGWTLQTQTNVAATNWVNVANSTTTNRLVIPINSTNGNAFYRLRLP